MLSTSRPVVLSLELLLLTACTTGMVRPAGGADPGTFDPGAAARPPGVTVTVSPRVAPMVAGGTMSSPRWWAGPGPASPQR